MPGLCVVQNCPSVEDIDFLAAPGLPLASACGPHRAEIEADAVAYAEAAMNPEKNPSPPWRYEHSLGGEPTLVCLKEPVAATKATKATKKKTPAKKAAAKRK